MPHRFNRTGVDDVVSAAYTGTGRVAARFRMPMELIQSNFSEKQEQQLRAASGEGTDVPVAADETPAVRIDSTLLARWPVPGNLL